MKIKKILTFVLSLFICVQAFSQAGIIDSSFGTYGVVATPLSTTGTATCRNILSLNTGKYLATGFINDGTTIEFATVRYNHDGSVDNLYGMSGLSKVAINGGQYSYAYCSALQTDGKLVMGGDYYDGTGYSFAVSRLTIDGDLDTTFGNGGFSTLGVGSAPFNNYGYGIGIQSDGKIILAGIVSNAGTADFGMARFNSNGSVDSTFGNNGQVVTAIGTSTDNCYSMKIQSDDKILLAGDISIGSAYVFTCVRYEIDGAIDSSFAVNGIGTYPMGANDDDYGYDITIQNDKKILFGGTSYNNGQYDFTILRIDSTGTLDNSFGTNGFASHDFNGTMGIDNGRRIALQSDGKIIVSGRTYVIGSAFGLCRFDENGMIDPTFGTNGVSYKQVASAQHEGFGLTIDSNDDIVLCGSARTLPDNFYVLRYLGGLNTGINEITNTEWHVYPNPNNGSFSLKIDSNDKESNVKIFDLTGNLIYVKDNLSNSKIQSELPTGAYIVQITTSANVKRVPMIIQ